MGDALQPEREPIPVLAHLRKTLGEYNFAGQYLQEPVPLGGGLVKKEWFKSYVRGDEPRKFDLIFQSWDTATKVSELSDFSVCTTWGERRSNLFLLNVFRRRLEFPDLKRAVIERARAYNPSVILIEDKSSGTQLIQELQRAGLHAITKYEPEMDKVMRLHSVTSTIEGGFVYLPEKADWLAEYLHEMTTFPKGKYDDQCDSTSQALDWVKQGHHPSGFMQWLEMEAKKAKNGGVDRCPDCGSTSFVVAGPLKHCAECGRQVRQTRA